MPAIERVVGAGHAMKTFLRFALIFLVIWWVVPNLPLYVERTMLRSMVMDAEGGGDVITYGWRVLSLVEFREDARYFHPEQQPELFLAINTALSGLYALVAAFVIDRLVARVLPLLRRGR